MLIRLLRRVLRPYRRAIVAAVALQGAQTLLSVYLPTLNAAIIDHGVARGDDRYIVRVGALMLAATFVQAALAVAAIRLSAHVATRVGRDVRAEVFRRVMDMPVGRVAEMGPAALTNRTIGDPGAVQDVVTAGLTGSVLAPLMCAGAVLMAVREDSVLSGLLLVILPAVVLVVGGVLRRLRPLAGRLRTRLDGINRLMREQVTGARVVRAFVRADHERDRFAATNADALATSVAVGRLTALMGPGILLVTNISTIAVLGVGGPRVTAGHMSVGALTAFVAYLTQIFMAASITTGLAAAIPRADACAERILSLLDGAPDGTATAVRPGARRSGGIQVNGLSVRHHGASAPVFSGVDLAAGPGETVAVVGGTGAGKSTLLHVMAGLVAPTAGTVRVAGTDIAAIPAAGRPALVGLVPQRAFLFAGTVGSNLRLGAPRATDVEMWAALEAAQAAAFVAAMPGGLAAPIAPGGANVSGGQRQRLAIARALLARPLVYLFDDPLAALDASTGAALRVTLRAWTAGSAVVVTGPAAAGDADRVVTLDADRVVEAR